MNNALDKRKLFHGLDEKVPYRFGEKAAVNLDSAATTPPFLAVMDEIKDKLLMYSSIGRGTGQKSVYSSDIYTKGRAAILDFVGANDSKYEVVYVNCTTDGMNKLASALLQSHRDMVLATRMEHHANDLPWRERGRVVYVDVDANGRLDIEGFQTQLERYNRYTKYSGDRVPKETIKYVTVTAASNVTGYINDVHRIAAIAHEYGAKIIVDGAQIVAHRAFSMKGERPEEDIDFFVFSAHKMYSPFGGGAIVGLKEVLDAHLPNFYGGGMVDMVTDNDVVYSKGSDRYEAGSPNYPGVVGMIKAIEMLKNEGFENIKQHEEELLAYAREKMQELNGTPSSGQVILYGDDKIENRVGILVFNLKRFANDVVAQYLASHAAIAVRHAKFCAHTYVDRLLGKADYATLDGCVSHVGMVRASFGLFTTKADIDELVKAVKDLLENGLDESDLFMAANASELPNDRG